jgi:hypothetical protein
MSGEGATADVDLIQNWCKNVSYHPQCAPKNTFNVNEITLFHNAQPKRTLALKEER